MHCIISIQPSIAFGFILPNFMSALIDLARIHSLYEMADDGNLVHLMLILSSIFQKRN